MDVSALIEQLDIPSAISPNECYRLFHGRGHAFPDFEYINIDWLPPVALITLYQDVEPSALGLLAQALQQRLPHAESIQVQYRHQHGGPFEVLLGKPFEQTVVEENGLKFHIQLGKAQNTGLFLDMRNGREWVRQHANDKRVLNLFAYTCGFSVAALAGGASHVVNIDNNKSVLSKGRENHRLNQHDLKRVTFERVDIFKSFSRLRKHGPYDLLVCDPPSFQQGSVDIRRDYKKIIRRLPEFMNPGSELMLCLNSPDLDEPFLLDMVAEACPACEFIQRLPNPEIFKEAMAGKGLKVLLFRYLGDEA
ncbi:MAG: class I SAM-dependent methyltransferase [Gammaproteobacteria bacterium]|nr:class I SAM-dependent methyltransferase [Gammaproteobacteria bacterium]